MPSFLIRLRRWLSRCAQAVALFTSSSPSVRCTEESSADIVARGEATAQRVAAGGKRHCTSRPSCPHWLWPSDRL